MMSPDDQRAQPYPTHSFSSPLTFHKSPSSPLPSRNRSSSLNSKAAVSRQILHIQYLLSEQTPRNTFSCEREVLHPLDPKAEPGALLFYDSDDSIEGEGQRPPKRRLDYKEALLGARTSANPREQMPDLMVQKLLKLRSSPEEEEDEALPAIETLSVSIPPSPPTQKQRMSSSSGVDASPCRDCDEHSTSTGRLKPSLEAQMASSHAPEYTLFPTIHKQSPPINRHRRRGAEDFSTPGLEETPRGSRVVLSTVKGKDIDALHSGNNEDADFQGLEHDYLGWAMESPSRSLQSGFGATSTRTALLDGDGQFRLPSPPYLKGAATDRRQRNRQTGIYGGSPVRDETRFRVSPERESHDFSHNITNSDAGINPVHHHHCNTCSASSSNNTPTPSLCTDNSSWPISHLDNFSHDLDTSSSEGPSGCREGQVLAIRKTNLQQSMAGSVVSICNSKSPPHRSGDGDAGDVSETRTTPRSVFHRRPSNTITGIDADNASSISGSNFQRNTDSPASIGSSAPTKLDNTDAPVPASAFTSRGTVTPGSLKTAPSSASGNRQHARFSVDSRMSERTPRRSNSGSRGLQTPTRLIGKVRSIFKSSGSSSTHSGREAPRRSVSFGSTTSDGVHQTVFEENLMLQTLEHRYQQHTFDRRQELVEALQYLASPSAALEGATLLNEFRRLRLETDSLFLLELERDALEKQRVHESQLNAAAARHERVRRDAESVRNDFETQVRRELERRREEEKRELDRIRQVKADQEIAERRRQVELARAQAAEELRQTELEKQRLEEETRIKVAEDARKIAEEKARIKAEAEQQHQIKAEEDKKAADLLTVSAAARGTSFTSVERENDNVNHMQDEYLRLHALLKGFRSWLTRHAKEHPAFKAKMGDMRREIKKTVGQLTVGKNANREPLSRINSILSQALNDSDSPKIDVRQFFILPNKRETDPSVMNQPPDRPALFLYLLNIFAKAVIAQFIDEAGVNPKAAEPVGVVAVTIFANDNFKWRGTPLIDILIAKFRRVCPVLFGLYGSDTTRAGRRRLGWHATDDGEWVSEQLHAERMTGLGAGYAALTLRNFSKSKMVNPYANVKYWQSLQWVCGVPPSEATDTHFIVLKAMIENYAGKFIDLYGDAAKLALRKALVTFPKESKRSSAAVQAVAALADALRRDEMIYLTNSEMEAEAKAIMSGVSFT
ncbi:hypothetical protein GP486_005015 [Trichoglossum hirsutum]|uniref:mRNA export factor GLE1 n=1 Tax=Trichoglossum hirsutum TaxID=265104 RepID=A0A9P8L9Z1_9PEZI|nr:hypothetical protein GP486_005015 [Trichoglossum hirsutum]